MNSSFVITDTDFYILVIFVIVPFVLFSVSFVAGIIVGGK